MRRSLVDFIFNGLNLCSKLIDKLYVYETKITSL